MVGASDANSSCSPARAPCDPEMFLCTSSLVVCTSARPSWGRTCLVQCCPLDSHSLGLNSPKLCPVQPLVTPRPVPALWNGSAVGRAGQGLAGTWRGVSGLLLLWGQGGSGDFCSVRAQSLRAVPSAAGQRGCLALGCPPHWQPLALQHGGHSLKGALGAQ